MGKNVRNHILKCEILDALPKDTKIFRYLIATYQHSDDELEKILKQVKEKYKDRKLIKVKTEEQEQTLLKFI